MSTTVGEPTPLHWRYILRPPPMSTSPPELPASVAATATTWNGLTKVITRKKKHARNEIAVLIARHKRLLLLSAIDLELFRSKDLSAPEFIGLTVGGGKPQQIELSIFVLTPNCNMKHAYPSPKYTAHRYISSITAK